MSAQGDQEPRQALADLAAMIWDADDLITYWARVVTVTVTDQQSWPVPAVEPELVVLAMGLGLASVRVDASGRFAIRSQHAKPDGLVVVDSIGLALEMLLNMPVPTDAEVLAHAPG